MDQVLKDYLEDCSTETYFQFQIRCESCGEVWKSRPVVFSYASVTPKTDGKRVIYQAIYQREIAAAYELAIKEAREIFSRCPICRHLVCDKCFLLCEEIEMCKDCAVKLQEEGIPVA